MHKTQFALRVYTALAIGVFFANANLCAQHMASLPQPAMSLLWPATSPQPTASPQQPTVSPQQFASTPQQPTASPQQFASTPQQPTASPQQFASTPQQPTASPQQLASTPQQLAASPQQSVTSLENPPQQIDLTQFPATAVDEVVVPLPSEIFNVLDKVGTPNWKEELPSSFGKNTGDRAQVALLLGAVIADGFIAVETEDTEKVKEIGREVLNLADAINVRKAVIARSKSITDKADAKDWQSVRKEFDGALQDVRTAMRELNDNDLAQLVSLGGWLRGTEVLTSIVKKDYNAQTAELLHQPELINYFLRRIDDMPRRLKRSDYVSRIRKVLLQIRPLAIRSGKAIIPKQDVEKINTLTHEVVLLFTAQQ